MYRLRNRRHAMHAATDTETPASGADAGACSETMPPFLGGKLAQLHHRRLAGGCAGCACRQDVDSTHSLRQQRLLGRNLITVFFTVNTRARFFFARAQACAAALSGSGERSATAGTHIHARPRTPRKKNSLFSAVCLRNDGCATHPATSAHRVRRHSPQAQPQLSAA